MVISITRNHVWVPSCISYLVDLRGFHAGFTRVSRGFHAGFTSRGFHAGFTRVCVFRDCVVVFASAGQVFRVLQFQFARHVVHVYSIYVVVLVSLSFSSWCARGKWFYAAFTLPVPIQVLALIATVNCRSDNLQNSPGLQQSPKQTKWSSAEQFFRTFEQIFFFQTFEKKFFFSNI